MTAIDPTESDPNHYRLLWENEDVRVLDYSDDPGARTTAHDHPNSVMITLTGFDRRLSADDAERNVRLESGLAVWLPAQRHSGENIGTTPTHTILVELKHSAMTPPPDHAVLGPQPVP